MARKSKKDQTPDQEPKISGYIKGAGEVLEEPVTDTIENNYMPYAMSVILSRAIPEIDGFKPSHRKLLYTMYKMGLNNGTKQKSSKIVGNTMALNPHGDAAIYDTLVRLTSGHEALLVPYVSSKGYFGKAYLRDTPAAASRYTEAGLAPVSAELFRDLSSDAVDMVDNFDNTEKEPSLLPVTFPTILANSLTGIAVGMASSFCSFNLSELVETTIAVIKDPKHDISQTLLAPDFPGGAFIVYDKAEIDKVYETGRGSIKLRSRYSYDKSSGCIEITEIPFSTTAEQIVEKVVELAKFGKLREINDIRDETDKNGLKITIDIKRSADPDKVMLKLYKLTDLECGFSCNFNVLIAGRPKVLGVRELLTEWVAFRTECVRRRVYFELTKRRERLHLLRGLEKIILDIDKAIKIIRETDEESQVVPNLMIGFGIDQIQAEFVAEIKLRHLNREYILNRTKDIEKLEKEIADREAILASKTKLQNIIIGELREVAKKYGRPRKSEILYSVEEAEITEEDIQPSYPVTLFFTKEGYFKKITPQSLRMSGEHKLKDGDSIIQTAETRSNVELMFFTNKCQVYKTRASEFGDTKASVMGDYVAAKLGMDDGETAVFMAVMPEYSGYFVFAFDNGKLAKVEASSYETKTNRRKLINAYSDKAPLVSIIKLQDDAEVLLTSSSGRRLIVHTGAITAKSTRDSQGVQIMTQKKGHKLIGAEIYEEGRIENAHRYRAKSYPAAGALPQQGRTGDQTSLLNN